MKKILLFISILVSFSTFGQVNFAFIEESKTIYDANGVCYNSDLNKWFHFNNAINNEEKYKKELVRAQGPYMMSQLYQNFVSIQTKKVIYNKNEFYILFIDKWEGHYKYPYLKQEWLLDRTLYGYVFSEENYKKLQSSDSIVEIETNKVFKVEYPFYTSRILDETKKSLSELFSNNNQIYVFPVRKEQSGLFKFLLPYVDNSVNREKYDLVNQFFEIKKVDFERLYIKIDLP